MSDERDVLLALCKYVNSLTNVGLTVEHLRLAECNAPDEITTEKLWSTLHILSYHAAREKRSDIDFRNYDTLTAVKLHLAFLQYPVTQFYGLSRDSSGSRDLLIALAWLLGTQDVLTTIFRTRLTNSALGAECSHVALPECNTSFIAPNKRPVEFSTSTQLDNILHLNAKVNLSLRQISELIREKGSLISKAHAASINVSGLPHLCVSELALTKRIVTETIDRNGSEDDRLREFRDAGELLDVRTRWMAKRDAFFNWMITVIHEESAESNPRAVDARELATFSSLLHYIVRDRLRGLTVSESADNEYQNSTLDCPSRTYRSQCDSTEEENWMDELKKHESSGQENLQGSIKLLADELKEMLKQIPSSIRV
ncbi:hypothetical protein DMN91_007006 [Ooceraea biroi]|uniref:Tubulin epsilon and delta complex protein 1 domain-containing protein n=1 Tax=Ooceraea biroi TaxID=2015173 RepID=A0A3L8DJ79_OOCBI|nr:uncharacterized protein LOC105282877 [Ooceraea biroi]XP_011343482.1 uncharacterized protein LOC105282877 [Ooceraea biroi]RLU20396.1 hypothetical protein DMN91_007006 [Ooceraea biroi]